MCVFMRGPVAVLVTRHNTHTTPRTNERAPRLPSGRESPLETETRNRADSCDPRLDVRGDTYHASASTCTCTAQCRGLCADWRSGNYLLLTVNGCPWLRPLLGVSLPDVGQLLRSDFFFFFFSYNKE